MATLDSNRLSGVSTVKDPTDAVYKNYVDTFGTSFTIPSQTGNDGKFLSTTDGTNYSWQNLSNYVEYTTPGTYTFNVPTQANMLYIEATGGGQGGGTGNKFSWDSWNSISVNSSTSRIAYGRNIDGQDVFLLGGQRILVSQGVLLSSTDSINWTIRTVSTGKCSGLTSYEYVDSQTGSRQTGFLGSFSLTNLRHSTDGIIWMSRTVANTGNSFNGEIKPPISGISTFFTFCGYNSLPLVSDYRGGTEFAVSTDTIVWTLRTLAVHPVASNFSAAAMSCAVSDISDKKYIICGRENSSISGSPGTGWVNVSTDTIVWTLRTLGNRVGVSTNNPTDVVYGNNIWVVGGNLQLGAVVNAPTTILTSTDTIVWTLRTHQVANDLNVVQTRILYVEIPEKTFICTRGGAPSFSTDGIAWTVRTVGTSNVINDILYSPSISTPYYYYAGGYISGSPVTHYRTSNFNSGLGGSAGSYGATYLPLHPNRPSSLTINVGSGGTGSNVQNTRGAVGSASTVSWVGLGGTYSFTVPGGGQSISTAFVNSHIFTSGIIGVSTYISPAVGTGLSSQQTTLSFQSGAGGQGALGSAIGNFSGGGSIINVYGSSIVVSGGSSFGSNGSSGIAITSLLFGSGGGGGGASASIAGAGGTGVRGGGGGGGGVAGDKAYGNGGNGGDGYVRISWM